MGLTLCVGWALMTSSASASPIRVRDEPHVDELHPSIAEGYLVWSESSPNRNPHSYVKPDGGPRVRIDPRRSFSLAASIDGTTVAYEEIRDDANIRFFDASTRDRSPAPEGVNTGAWEYDPALSGNWLMFQRSNINKVKPSKAFLLLVLFNLDTGARRVLRDVAWNAYYFQSDQVNGDWATFESCRTPRAGFSDCQVWRYRISTRRLVKIPNPGKQQYAGGVTTDGTVYFVRTGHADTWACGARTGVWRYPVGGPAVKIWEFKRGTDVLASFAFEEPGGHTSWYFHRFKCRAAIGGIYRLAQVESRS
jgi:hypothetical protein